MRWLTSQVCEVKTQVSGTSNDVPKDNQHREPSSNDESIRSNDQMVQRVKLPAEKSESQSCDLKLRSQMSVEAHECLEKEMLILTWGFPK